MPSIIYFAVFHGTIKRFGNLNDNIFACDVPNLTYTGSLLELSRACGHQPHALLWRNVQVNTVV